MGMIKGFYIDSNGQVQTYMTKERFIEPEVPVKVDCEVVMTKETKRRDWKARRKARIKNRAIRCSVFAASLMAFLFAMTLAGEDPNWAVSIIGAGVNLGWVALVIEVNGGTL